MDDNSDDKGTVAMCDGAQATPEQQYELTYTGERYLPWSHDFITAYEHVHRYLYATRYTAGNLMGRYT